MNLAAFREWLELAGVTAYVMVFSGVVLLVLSIERLMFLYIEYARKNEEALGAIRLAVLARDYAKAIQICNVTQISPEISIVKAGLMAVDHGREAIRSALGGAVLDVSRSVERRVPIIALIAGVSTLLGLLGTISGLIRTFAALGQADAAQKAEMLGKGISEAMYSTATGLALGIVAMVVHTLCTSKGDEIVGLAQNAGYKLVTWVEESERGTSTG